MKSLIIFLIKIYKYSLSPFLGKNCRFYPSCSEYCKESFIRYSFLNATYFSVKRLLKCHPFHPGGVDELPKL